MSKAYEQACRASHLTPETTPQMVRAYHQHARVTDIAKKHGITRQGVYKILKRAGVDVSKHRVAVACTICGEPSKPRTRGQLRRTRTSFCSRECYFMWMRQQFTGITSRYHNRRAREIVGALFALSDEHIVHHVDGDPRNNSLDNLWVLKSARSHVRLHKGFDIKPIWRGVGMG